MKNILLLLSLLLSFTICRSQATENFETFRFLSFYHNPEITAILLMDKSTQGTYIDDNGYEQPYATAPVTVRLHIDDRDRGAVTLEKKQIVNISVEEINDALVVYYYIDPTTEWTVVKGTSKDLINKMKDTGLLIAFNSDWSLSGICSWVDIEGNYKDNVLEYFPCPEGFADLDGDGYADGEYIGGNYFKYDEDKEKPFCDYQLKKLYLAETMFGSNNAIFKKLKSKLNKEK